MRCRQVPPLFLGPEMFPREGFSVGKRATYAKTSILPARFLSRSRGARILPVRRRFHFLCSAADRVGTGNDLEIRFGRRPDHTRDRKQYRRSYRTTATISSAMM